MTHGLAALILPLNNVNINVKAGANVAFVCDLPKHPWYF
jgi:hypothetical protein